MRHHILLVLLASFVASTPLPGDSSEALIHLGRATADIDVVPFGGELLQQAQEATAALTESNFDIEEFLSSLYSRSAEPNAHTPSSLLLAERQAQCPTTLTPAEIAAISSLANSFVAALSVGIIPVLGTVSSLVINNLGTIFAGIGTQVLGNSNALVIATVREVIAALIVALQ